MLMSAYAAPVIPPLTFGVTVGLASGIPFLIVVFLAIRERRARRISWSEMLGLFFGLPSLLLSMFFIRATILLWIGMRHEAAHNIPAPTFQARDLNGNDQRLADHKGEVVLVNVWATWCGYCWRKCQNSTNSIRSTKITAS
jgi:thiol:disulfide interchange protein